MNVLNKPIVLLLHVSVAAVVPLQQSAGVFTPVILALLVLRTFEKVD